jgi:hypothetical protein
MRSGWAGRFPAPRPDRERGQVMVAIAGIT